jgi:hypothetical protein
MLRMVLLMGLGLSVSLNLFGQLKKFYSVSEEEKFEVVNFHLKAASGNTYIKNYAEYDQALVIFGNPDLNKINPSFETQVSKGTCTAKLKLENFQTYSFGDGFSFVMTKKSSEEDGNFWKILVNEHKIYRFNMTYGFGNTDINLTDVKTKKVWLSTGSANVNVGYDDKTKNLIKMDTFYVKVDMGKLVTRNLSGARAKSVIADVGFGSAILDFGTTTPETVRVDAKVGAGSLAVIIPNANVPVIIHVKESPFCGMKLKGDFEQVEKNVYVNKSYAANAKNLMTFNIDLAMGNVSFAYKE